MSCWQKTMKLLYPKTTPSELSLDSCYPNADYTNADAIARAHLRKGLNLMESPCGLGLEMRTITGETLHGEVVYAWRTAADDVYITARIDNGIRADPHAVNVGHVC